MTDNSSALKLIRAVEEADSSALLLEAVQQLADAKLSAAIPILIAALGYNNPGAAVAAVDGLINLGEPAVEPLLKQLDGYNYSARAWAVRALAGIGDPRGLSTLLHAAKNDFAMSVRRAAVKGLGAIDWHLLPPDEVLSAQAQALEALLLVCQDGEWIVRYAAVVGLELLGVAVSISQPDWTHKISAHLQILVHEDSSLAVCARAVVAQQRLESCFDAVTMSTNVKSAKDWRSTLETLYSRKSQERKRPLSEGDPRKFIDVAARINTPLSDS
jgi:phycocyanobilin lyase subunit beta